MPWIAWKCLTHSCLDISLTGVIGTCDIYQNNSVIKHLFQKHLKESCRLSYNEHFSFIFLTKSAFLIKNIAKMVRLFLATVFRINWLRIKWLFQQPPEGDPQGSRSRVGGQRSKVELGWVGALMYREIN